MKFLTRKNYLARIQTSVGSNFFRNLFYEIDGQETDILEDGSDSCAFHVSTILKMCALIEGFHATVKGTVADMKKSGWIKKEKPELGCVILWAQQPGEQSGVPHQHLGFYIGDGKAISNSSEKKQPIIHDWDYRPIEKLFIHEKIAQTERE